MVTEAATDRRLLTEQAYPDSTNLRARQSIYDFKVPLDDFDRLLAPHMLYHAPDPDRGAVELRRVVRPEGVALVVTNDRQHVGHLVDQLSEATGTAAPVRFIDRFTLENGLPLLERHFEQHGAWRTATHSGVFVCR